MPLLHQPRLLLRLLPLLLHPHQPLPLQLPLFQQCQPFLRPLLSQQLPP